MSETELQRARRAYNADPESAERRRDLLGALLRAGCAEESEAFVREGFSCPVEWHEMTQTQVPTTRRCESCAREVRFVTSLDAIQRCADEGACIAAPEAALAAYARALAERATSDPRALDDHPCGAAFDIGVAKRRALFELDPQLIADFPRSAAWRFRTLPLRRDARVLVLAVDAPPSPRDREDLHRELSKLLGGRRLAFESVPTRALNEAMRRHVPAVVRGRLPGRSGT